MENSLDCHYSGLSSPKAYDMENKQPFEFNNDTNVGFINPFTNTPLDIGGQTKTAMRQMVDYINELKSKTTDESERYLLTALWSKAVFLLDVETEQLMDKYGEGYDEGLYDGEYK